MKKFWTMALLVFMTAAIAGCGGKSAQTKTQAADTGKAVISKAQAAAPSSKSLIVYFSHSGNTRALAEQIKAQTGADMLELRTTVPYTTVYNDLTKQARQELDSGYRPALQPLNLNLADYKTIFLGSPIWWGTVAPPVITFLSQNDLSNKTIIPFVTHEGSGLSRSANQIKELAPQANLQEALAVRGSGVGSAQATVEKWLKRLAMN